MCGLVTLEDALRSQAGAHLHTLPEMIQGEDALLGRLGLNTASTSKRSACTHDEACGRGLADCQRESCSRALPCCCGLAGFTSSAPREEVENVFER